MCSAAAFGFRKDKSKAKSSKRKRRSKRKSLLNHQAKRSRPADPTDAGDAGDAADANQEEVIDLTRLSPNPEVVDLTTDLAERQDARVGEKASVKRGKRRREGGGLSSKARKPSSTGKIHPSMWIQWNL